jgi:hypothetical protein
MGWHGRQRPWLANQRRTLAVSGVDLRDGETAPGRVEVSMRAAINSVSANRFMMVRLLCSGRFRMPLM